MASQDHPVSDPQAPNVAVVVPLFNERPSLEELHQQLTDALTQVAPDAYEIIFVDDGSTDGSFDVICQVAQRDPRVRAIQFRRNFGKSAALTAGFRAARGRFVITIDADLQDDPKEIPRFLDKINEGYDLVSGWKRVRRDPPSKTAASRLFNAVVRAFSKIDIHDFNCGFKCYRREVVDQLRIYGDLHRYIPVLAGMRGFAVTEIEVEHHPRRHGRSKYGLGRMRRGLFDLLTVLFLTRYLRRPLHLFGSVGAVCSGLGGVCLAYLVLLWLLGYRPIGNRPLLFFGGLLFLFGFQLIFTGLVCELLIRETGRQTDDYTVRQTLPKPPV